jgi:hypothetical protein
MDLELPYRKPEKIASEKVKKEGVDRYHLVIYIGKKRSS